MTIEQLQSSGLGIVNQIKRKVFVSYHHKGDQSYYEEFSKTFADNYQMIFDNSLERKMDSDNSDYIIRRIREEFITGTSCTVILVGRDTWGRKFVDWEISATLEKQHGLLAFQLPTLPLRADGMVSTPGRLHDNIISKYAVWQTWSNLIANPNALVHWIEEANSKDKRLIKNDRERRLKNA